MFNAYFKYGFWLIGGASGFLMATALYLDNMLAVLGFFLLFIINLCAALVFLQAEVNEQAWQEYEKSVQRQAQTKVFRLIKGGKA